MSYRNAAALPLLCLMALSQPLCAATVIEERFGGYPDNALISVHPAGGARGLQGDWVLDAESDFYVNRTQLDMDAGTGKAVYDRPSDDNGARLATRNTSADHVIFNGTGDLFYASFLIRPARVSGGLTFELHLDKVDGGGQRDFSFGILGGHYIVGNGGTEVDASGGIPVVQDTFVLVRIENGDSGTGPGDDEIVTLWVNPVSESSTPVINNVPVDLFNNGGGKITAVSIRGEHMAGQPAFIDNLRVGREFGDVLTVEPIPAVSGWSLIIMLLLFPLIAAIRITTQNRLVQEQIPADLTPFKPLSKA